MSGKTLPYYRDCPSVRYDGVRVHYEVRGEGEPPLVLLHGLGMTNFTWSRNVAALARTRRVIVVEHMAMGDRTGLLRHGYGLENLAGAVLEVMNALGVERADVCGVSLGGALALFLAVAHHRRVRRLVLIGPAAYPVRWPVGLGLARVPILGEIGSLLMPARLFGLAVVANCFARPAQAPPGFAREFAEVYRSLAGRVAMLRTVRALPPFDVRSIVEGYHHVEAPALILWGKHDALLTPRVPRQLVRDLPNAKLVILREGAHAPHMELPDLVNPLIIDWLDRAEGDTR
ncbi:MAG TPA: alpha/beta hydrolase [Planctomycetota bacterium]|nr:alpha/beta hydrolase [Planctomycetota bacterium]